MSGFLPFARPDLTVREIDEVVDTLRSGWLTTGPKTRKFEQAFADRVGAPHAVAVNSCTAALHLALEAVGLTSQDEVIVPGMTFAATAEVVRYFGAKPVIVDVLESDHQIDPSAVERAFTERTKAIIPVHFAGQACDLDPIIELARSKGAVVIEDAAHALPASYKGRNIGTVGDITCFSFYATKTLATGEGGMATTANEDWANRMRVMALHGISKDAWKRYTAEGSWYYEIVAPGYKYNMTDVAAALGVVQLERLDEMLARRRQIADRYRVAFGDVDALDVLDTHPDRDHSWHLFVVKLDPEQLDVDRNGFIDLLKEQGIGSSVHFIPLHRHPYYRDTYGYVPTDLPVANAVYERSVSLPIYSAMTDAEVQRVIDTVTMLLAEHRR
ncbi:MAG: DegT/DnrJ/EryC1/StrS family aminotransferase [Polyangiaceae bacterium]